MRGRIRRALLLVLAGSTIADAQAVLGPGDDAWTLPAGVLRVGLAPRFMLGDARFGAAGTREPLAAWLDRDAVSSAAFASLAPLESSLRDLSGRPDFALSLGSVSADLQRQVQVIPLEASVGITNRLMLRVFAPIVATEHQAAWRFSGEGATVGANPAINGPASLAQNTALLASLGGAADQLDALADACAVNAASDPRCGSVLGDLSAVRALTSAARAFRDAAGAVYGGIGAPPSALIPMSGTTADAGVQATIASLRTAFLRYGETGIDATSTLVGAELPATAKDFLGMLTDTAGSYALGPWDRRYTQGFGDVDVGVWWRVAESRSAAPWSRLTDTTVGWRQSIGVTARLGTGSITSADDPLQIGTGDGQHDIELTSITDVLWGRRWWTTVLVRYTKQLSDERAVRLPDPLLSPYLPLTRRVLAEQQLGDRLQAELSPRWVMNDYLAAGLRYRVTHQGATSWSEVGATEGVTPLTAMGEAMTAHEVAVGATWSSIAAWQRGRSRRPVEVSWERSIVVAGSGDAWASTTDRIGVLVYAKLWGR